MTRDRRAARLELRRAYRCDCEGEVFPEGRRPGTREGKVALGALEAIRTACGGAPPECPWRATSDPEVRQVIDAWGTYDKGQFSTMFGGDPPNWLAEGVLVFGRALEDARANVREREKREREAVARVG